MDTKLSINLFLFDEGGQGDGEHNENESGSSPGTFTYEQLNEIATSRAEHAEKAAIKNYLQRQGISEDEANEVFTRYKQQKEKDKPNVAAIEQERDTALKELEQLKNSGFLRDKGVKAEDIDYVLFKVEKLMDDKTDFTKAAEKFLKENPRFTRTGTYKVWASGETVSHGAGGSTYNTINDAIRNAARR